MKRTNKEINLNLTDSCVISYGITNKLNPKVIYVTCRTWIRPKENKDYHTIIEDNFKILKKELFNKISTSNIFDKNFITNFEITKSTFKINKKNFLNFEIFLKQKNNILMLQDLEYDVTTLFKPLIINLIENFENNSLILTKR